MRYALLGAIAVTLGCVQTASAVELTSTKDRGVVSIASDPALSDGRLVVKVVAFNRMKEPAAFGDANVKITTAAGVAVPLMSLEKLVGNEKSARGRGGPGDHNPSNYSHPGIPTNGVGGGGEPDVSGYTGSANPTSGVASSHTPMSNRADPESEARIAALKAAILQPMTIAPAAAAGGQVVTEKLKLSRKDPRGLRVVVDFNDEQHEFELEAPRENKRN